MVVRRLAYLVLCVSSLGGLSIAAAEPVLSIHPERGSVLQRFPVCGYFALENTGDAEIEVDGSIVPVRDNIELTVLDPRGRRLFFPSYLTRRLYSPGEGRYTIQPSSEMRTPFLLLRADDAYVFESVGTYTITVKMLDLDLEATTTIEVLQGNSPEYNSYFDQFALWEKPFLVGDLYVQRLRDLMNDQLGGSPYSEAVEMLLAYASDSMNAWRFLAQKWSWFDETKIAASKAGLYRGGKYNQEFWNQYRDFLDRPEETRAGTVFYLMH